MKSNDKDIERELNAALGRPKYYIDTPGLKDDERYHWFPTLGDSMTDDTAKSIPGGSLVLGRCLNVNSIRDVPLHCPLVLIINYEGEQFCLLKCACDFRTFPAERAGVMWKCFACEAIILLRDVMIFGYHSTVLNLFLL